MPDIGTPIRGPRTGSSTRVILLDHYRYIIVSFALLSHILLSFDLRDLFAPDVYLVVRSITRSATPSLLMLFGIMLELVYFRRYRAEGGEIVHQLVHRAILCYLALVAMALTLAMMKVLGHGPLAALGDFGQMALLLTPTQYANVFYLYVALLMVAFFVIAIRARVGMSVLAIGGIAMVWLVDFLFIDGTAQRHAGHLLGMTFGVGDRFGPTVWHGLSLVFIGMLAGRVFFGKGGRAECCTLGATVLACMLVVGIEIGTVGIGNFMRGLEDITVYRFSNELVYYCYGVVCTLLLLGLTWLAGPLLRCAPNDWAARIGASTLVYFFAGNILIVVLARLGFIRDLPSYLLVPGLFVCFGAIVLFHENVLRKQAAVIRVNAFLEASVSRSVSEVYLRFCRSVGIRSELQKS